MYVEQLFVSYYTTEDRNQRIIDKVRWRLLIHIYFLAEKQETE